MAEEAEVIEQEVSKEAAPQDSSQSQNKVTYANDGSEGLAHFLANNVGENYLDKVSEKQITDSSTPKEEVQEESKEEESTISDEDQKKIEDLLAKNEESGLSAEEIEFMKSHGYDPEEPEEIEDDPEKAKKEEEEPKKEEEIEAIDLPKEFIEDLDDFFSDDDSYDPEKITVPERLQYAQKAMAKMRENQSALSRAFADNPELAGFVSDVVVNGIDPGTSAKKHFADILEEEVPKAGTPEYDKWVIQREDQKREKKRIQKLQEKQKENFQLSLKKAVEFVDTHKLSEKQRKEVFEEADRRIQSMANGIIDESFYRSVMRDLNYDKDMEKAEQLGKTKMANQKIKFKKRQGDGLPKPQTVKAEPKKTVKYSDDIAEGLDNFFNS